MKPVDSRSVLLTGLTIAVVLLTIVLSLAFAQAQQTERVAMAADQRQDAADAATIAALTRSQMEAALLFSAADEVGVTQEGQKEAALDALRSTGTRYAESDNPAIVLDRKGITSGLSDLIALLEEGDTEAARTLMDTNLIPRLANIQEAATANRQLADEIIAVESSTAGRWGLIASFGVAVIVPSVALIAFRSIVTRRRRNLELQQQLERESELNAAKDEMISNLSHELRTPLTGIYGFALAMEESGFDDAVMQSEMTNLIIHEAADLSRMVDDLLTAAKAEGDGLHFQTENVDVAREVYESVTPFQRGPIEIGLDVEPGVVIADRLRLRQILRNLVSNATDHGGPNVRLIGMRDGDRYVFEVTDDGAGVPDQVVERLFERFVHQGETPLLTGSIGLGLSIVKVLAAGMDGTVAYERREDTTIFKVTLPLTDEEGSSLDDVSSPLNLVPARSGPLWSRGPAPATEVRNMPAPVTPPEGHLIVKR